MITRITDEISMITIEDHKLDLFEGQYPVPDGITYNSYIITDKKIAIMETADETVVVEWMEELDRILGDRVPDIFIVHHMEPDHASLIGILAKKYPNIKFVGTKKALPLMNQFFGIDFTSRFQEVAEGDVIDLGETKLNVIAAPMVHWPEVMMTFEPKNGILFSADGFGRFGPADPNYDWIKGARRYYLNIVGKFGGPVQKVLAKAAGLQIKKICPLHGPVLDKDLGKYIALYDKWSKFEHDTEGVLIAYASIYGNTKRAAETIAQMIEKEGVKTKLIDVVRTHPSFALEDAFSYGKIILAAVTYEGALFTWMENFLYDIENKKIQKKKFGLIENGSWGPTAAKGMLAHIEKMESCTVCEPIVTIKSAISEENICQLEALAKEIVKD